jgi:hypothetical protein
MRYFVQNTLGLTTVMRETVDMHHMATAWCDTQEGTRRGWMPMEYLLSI